MKDLRENRLFWIVIVLATLTVAFRVVGTSNYFSMGFLGISDEDDEIVRLEPGLPAAQSGLRVGDRIVETGVEDRRPRIGQNVTYVVERGDQTLRFDVTAAPLPRQTLGFLVAAGVMGLAFLVIGLAVFLRTGRAPGALLALYGICQALHWGGNPDVSSAVLRHAMWTMILLATMLAAAFLLHLALLFRPAWPLASRRSTLVWLYAPTVLALAVAAFGLDTAFYLLMNVQAYLYTLAAFVVMIIRRRRADAVERRAHGLGVMTWGFLAAVVPYLAALGISEAAPDLELPGGLGPFPYTLFFVLIPVVFAIGILKSHRDRMSTAVPG